MQTPGDVVDLDLGQLEGLRGRISSSCDRDHGLHLILDAGLSVAHVVPPTSTICRSFDFELVIEPDTTNGLSDTSAAQCQHLRAVSPQRIVVTRGNVGPPNLSPDSRNARRHPRHRDVRTERPDVASARAPSSPHSQRNFARASGDPSPSICARGLRSFDIGAETQSWWWFRRGGRKRYVMWMLRMGGLRLRAGSAGSGPACSTVRRVRRPVAEGDPGGAVSLRSGGGETAVSDGRPRGLGRRRTRHTRRVPASTWRRSRRRSVPLRRSRRSGPSR